VSVIAALGLTQIIGYGTLYYSFSILAPDMAREIGWTVDGVFAVFSISLLVGGIAAPLLGSLMDRYGAARLMALGSLLAAFTLVLCAYSASAAVFIASIVLLEIASGMVQYQAAFAALVEFKPTVAAKSITYLTLIAGFASTLFWPITSSLHGAISWRDIFLIYAALNLIICAPVHVWLVGRGTSGQAVNGATKARREVQGSLPPGHRKRGFYLASMAFALQGFALSSMLVHMVPMLTGLGLGGAAVLVSMIFGPSQVLSRLINMLFGKTLRAPMLALLSAGLIVGGIAVLLISGNAIAGACIFALLLGLGSGVNSIAQGALPLYLFGSTGYGTLTGKMAAIRLIASAAAPFAFAALSQVLVFRQDSSSRSRSDRLACSASSR
jgi:MFS family permease